MTNNDALLIAELITDIDGGCPHCMGSFCDEMKQKFPEFDWRAMVLGIDPSAGISPKYSEVFSDGLNEK